MWGRGFISMIPNTTANSTSKSSSRFSAGNSHAKQTAHGRCGIIQKNYFIYPHVGDKLMIQKAHIASSSDRNMSPITNNNVERRMSKETNELRKTLVWEWRSNPRG